MKGTSPITNAITNFSSPKLIACPTVRIVATAAEATYVSSGGTESMRTLVFGGENKPKPIP